MRNIRLLVFGAIVFVLVMAAVSADRTVVYADPGDPAYLGDLADSLAGLTDGSAELVIQSVIADTVTVTASFTSPGIDDNADDIAITIDVTTEKVNMSADADVVAALTAGTIASDATVVAATTMSTGTNAGTSGQVNYIASDNDQGNSAITTSDELAHTGFSGGLTNDSNIQGTTLESASATPTVTFDDTSEQDWTILTGDGDMHISGASEYVTIDDPTGWVGIGDTTPDSPLDVVGGVRADSLLIGDNWRIVATSTVMKWENY